MSISSILQQGKADALKLNCFIWNAYRTAAEVPTEILQAGQLQSSSAQLHVHRGGSEVGGKVTANIFDVPIRAYCRSIYFRSKATIQSWYYLFFLLSC